MTTTVSAVSSVGGKLSNLPVPDGVVHDQVMQLRSDLDLIENYLASNQSKAGNNDNNMSGDVLKQVRQLAYDIEDAVESYAAGEPKVSVFRKRSTTREDLSFLMMRMEEVKNIISIRSTTGGGNGSSPPLAEHNLRRRVPDYLASSDVPLMDQVSEIKYQLFDDGQSNQLSVTVIMGMPGVGKTTLAGFCYNDRSVTEYFDIRAWVTVGRTFQARDILETILFSLASAWSRDEIAGMETMELINQLQKAQKDRTYLIVLDDVWSLKDWNTLRFAFRDDRNGSRILVTSRAAELQKITTFAYFVRFMTPEESFEFLRLKSGGLLDNPGQIHPEINEIAREIAYSCDGLPVVVAVIGGAMRTGSLEEWKGMERLLRNKHMLSSTTGRNSINILTLGYDQLPLHLKPCFLYLGYFPHSQPIPVEKLCLLWIAEGLISVRGSNIDKSQMEVAEEYFDELFDRNLVIVVVNEEVPDFTRFQSCKLNDSIREMCIQKGGEEEFFKVTYENGIRNLSGRVALCFNTNDVPLNISEGNDIRSILFYDTVAPHSTQTRPREVPGITEFHRTRVLDFDGVDFRVKKLPRGIERLIYLRHLSFRGCYLHEFTSSLSSFPFLETLDLRVRASCKLTIHNVLRKLSRLKHLYFPLAFRCDDIKDKLKLDGLTKLQVLENFNARLCDVDDLLQLENLRILTVSVDGNNMDLKKINSCLNKNKFLHHSSVVVENFDSYSKERLSIVATLLQCNALHALDIEGYLGVTLLHKGIGSNFTSLVFNGSEFSDDPVPILGKLRNLRSLVLCNDAFVAKKMVCSESDFPQLTSLELATLQSLEKWEVEGDVCMPRLAILTIEKCDKLEEIPWRLSENSSTLRKIIVRSMPKEFQDKVKETIDKLMSTCSYEY